MNSKFLCESHITIKYDKKLAYLFAFFSGVMNKTHVASSSSGDPKQVEVGVEEGLKHSSSIHCDELVSLSKSALTGFVATLSPAKLDQLDRALAMALEIRAEKS